MKKPAITEEGLPPIATHRFLDEAGDPTFFKKGKVVAIGDPGVSLAFSIGMVNFRADLNVVRTKIIELQNDITLDNYLNALPSVKKKIAQGGFFFHATDDPAEIRMIMYRFIKNLECSFEMVVARKIPALFAKNHHNQESEFYSDLLSHLIKGKLKLGQRLVLNIAERGASTRNANLVKALEIAKERALKKWRPEEICSTCVFNVQTPRIEPLLSVADYLRWAVQRIFERGETRYYDYIKDKASVIIDLYDFDNYPKGRNYYKRGRSLTANNKISPPLP
jgi:hypothetical protein